MRRSQAPSMRPRCTKEEWEDQEMQWGTRGGGYTGRPRPYCDDENPLRCKRIFLVLWRQQSNKKHKIWTGNGTLEVTDTLATLKNECGEILDVLKCFKHEKIHEEALLEIDMKDVEIQQELKTKAECVAQRKEEIENWYQKQDEAHARISDGPNYLPRRRGLRWMHPFTRLNKATTTRKFGTTTTREIGTTFPNEIATATPREIATSYPYKPNVYICLLKPSDLQLQMLHLLTEDTNTPYMEKLEIANYICDHPLLLKNHVENQLVSEVLLPHLPAWHDIGLDVSTKFKFVYQMLDNLVVNLGASCAIVANSQRCLDIIQGYCQTWGIPHQQLGATSKTSAMPEDAMVFLLLSSNLPPIRLTSCKYLIIYNYSARSADVESLVGGLGTRIYTLITAGCLEEREFQQDYELVQDDNRAFLIQATPKLLRDHKDNVLARWTQRESPFSKAFLKEAFNADASKSEELSCLSFVLSYK